MGRCHILDVTLPPSRLDDLRPMHNNQKQTTARERAEEFSSSIVRTRNVIACRVCGSTNVDQRTRYSVRCGSCGVESYFDGESLAVIGNGHSHEATSCFSRDEKRSQDEGWQASLRGALGELLNVTESVLTTDNQPVFDSNDFKRFTECWERCRPIIERECRRVKRLH